MSIDGNGRRVAADPYAGTVEAVLECASNLACVGAEPLGTTNNLNFGNPEKPHVAWQLSEVGAGLGDACRALQAPIVGGNVSLYNEGADRPDLPDAGDRHGRTPARRPRAPGGSAFAARATRSRSSGRSGLRSAASELSKLRGEALPDGLAEIDIDAVRAAQLAVREAVRAGAAGERARHRRGRARGRAGRVLPGRRARRAR